jgi:hypothetical protein
MSHLQQFIFGERMPASNWKHELRFLVFCTEYLPHLRVAGHSFDVMDVDDLEINGCRRARGYHSKLMQRLKKPTTLSLQLLNLADDVVPANGIKFSVLEKLALWKPSNRLLDWCDRHAKLTALGLYDCGDLNVLPVLCQVGQRLQTLVLDTIYQEFSLAQVLQLCPNLKHFKVSSCKVKKAPEKLPEKVICHLENVVVDCMKLTPGFLRQVN